MLSLESTGAGIVSVVVSEKKKTHTRGRSVRQHRDDDGKKALPPPLPLLDLFEDARRHRKARSSAKVMLSFLKRDVAQCQQDA